MLNTILVLLTSQVMANSCWYDVKPRRHAKDISSCDGRGESLSCERENSSCDVLFGVDRRKPNCCISGPYSRYPGDMSRDFEDPKALSQLVNLLPFISSYTSSSSRHFLPYVEFANIAEFYVPIPDKARLWPLFQSVDICTLVKLACKLACFENYDAFNAFFYNADSLSGICTREFDDNYILWFLIRFLYFLDLIQCDNPCKFRDNLLWSCDWVTQIDLLAVPAKYANITFGTRANALRLFNKIITDTVLTKYLVQFIICLVKQLEKVEACHASCFKLPPFTTLTTYIFLLRSYLLRTAAISEFNYKIKLEFLLESKVFAFIEIPIKLRKHEHCEESESRSSYSYSSDYESSSCDEHHVHDAVFVEILDFCCHKLRGTTDIRSSFNIAVYTKAGIARFL